MDFKVCKILLNIVGINIIFWILALFFDIDKYYFFAAYITIVYIFVLYFNGLFNRKRYNSIDLLFKVIKSSIISLFVIAAVAHIDWSFRLPRYMILLFCFFSGLIIYILQYLDRRTPNLKENCLIIGRKRDIINKLEKEYNIIGFLDDKYKSPIDNKPWLGKLNEVRNLIEQYNISCLIFAAKNEILDIILECNDMNIKFKIIPNLYPYVLTNRLDEGLLIDILIRPANIVYLILKRVIDIIGSFVLIIVLFPIYSIIAIVIKLDSSGSIFYKQERLAIFGKHFDIIKFRTMINNAEKNTGPIIITHKTEDPRITKIGKFLRSTHLDELPQLINILLGHMSFVGPRPERPIFSSELNKKIKEWNNRLYIKPGLTGFAQIACIGSLNARDKIQKDLYYIKNMSLLLDLKIVIKTILKILKGK